MTTRTRLSAFQLMAIAGMLGVIDGSSASLSPEPPWPPPPRRDRGCGYPAPPSKPDPPPEHIQKRLDAAAEKRRRRAERNLRNAGRDRC